MRTALSLAALLAAAGGAHTLAVLTVHAQKLRVIDWTTKRSQAVSEEIALCKFVGTARDDDRNELLNLAARRDADTVVIRKYDAFGPVWHATFYTCGEPKP